MGADTTFRKLGVAGGSRSRGGMTWGTFGHTQYGQVLSPCVTVVPGLCHIPAALGVHAAAQPP